MNTTSMCLSVFAVLAACVSHRSQASILEVDSAPISFAGNSFKLRSTLAAPKEVDIDQDGAMVTLQIHGQTTNIAVEISVRRHDYGRTLSNQQSSLTAYELRIQSREGDFFSWSCWTPDFPIPHRVKVMTTESNKSYLGYTRSGVHLFRLSGSRDSEEVGQQFWQSLGDDAKHIDALPTLQVDLLKQSLGKTNTYGIGPQKVNVTVDGLAEVSGELQLTVHGAAPQPQCTFVLRNGKWELLSTASK